MDKTSYHFPVDDHPFLAPGYKFRQFETTLQLIKNSVGVGVFALPKAFCDVGYLVAVPLTLITIGIYIICSYQMSKVLEVLYDRNTDSEVSETNKLKKFPYRKVTQLIFIVFNMGLAASFIMFFSLQMGQVIEYYYRNNFYLRTYLIIFFIPFLLLVLLIDDLRQVAFLHFVSDCCLIFGIFVIFYFTLGHVYLIVNRNPVGELTSFPMFFGIILYALAPGGRMLPSEEELKQQRIHPSRFASNCAVLVKVILYIAIGWSGCSKYGSNLQSILTLSFPNGNLMAIAVKFTICVSMFIKYVFMLHVPFNIIWNDYLQPLDFIKNSNHQLIYKNIFKCIIQLLTFGMACMFPNTGIFLSFCGSVLSTIPVIILPPIFHWIFCSEEYKRTSFLLGTYSFIIVLFGLSIFISGAAVCFIEGLYKDSTEALIKKTEKEFCYKRELIIFNIFNDGL